MKGKLLIYHPGALGDIVLTFPHLARLKHRFSDIDLICRAEIGRLAVYLGLATKVFSIDSALIASLFTDQPAAKIADIIRSYRAVLLFSAAEPLFNAVSRLSVPETHLVNSRPPIAEKVWVPDYLEDCLVRKGLLQQAAADQFHSGLIADKTWNPSACSPTIILHPGSGSRRKNWPLPDFIALGELLRQRREPVEFLLGPAESEQAARLNPSAATIDLHQRDLCQLAEKLLSAQAFIGNDSGVTHLAAFLGVPTLALFGPSDPVRWRPNGARVSIVTASIDCNPCFETQSENCPQSECLHRISPEQALRAYSEKAIKSDAFL